MWQGGSADGGASGAGRPWRSLPAGARGSRAGRAGRRAHAPGASLSVPTLREHGDGRGSGLRTAAPLRGGCDCAGVRALRPGRREPWCNAGTGVAVAVGGVGVAVDVAVAARDRGRRHLRSHPAVSRGVERAPSGGACRPRRARRGLRPGHDRATGVRRRPAPWVRVTRPSRGPFAHPTSLDRRGRGALWVWIRRRGTARAERWIDARHHSQGRRRSGGPVPRADRRGALRPSARSGRARRGARAALHAALPRPARALVADVFGRDARALVFSGADDYAERLSNVPVGKAESGSGAPHNVGWVPVGSPRR